MVARTRSGVYPRTSGPRWFNNNPGVLIGAGSISTDTATCSDQVDVNDCFPLTINKRSTSGGIINKYDSGSFSSQFRDYIADWLRTSGNGPHLGVSGIPSDVSTATSAAARTNPSRPYVDVPVNILDIKTRIGQIREDFNDLLRRFPRRYRPRRPLTPGDLTRETGSAWLEYQFLIAPVVGDIVKLTNAHDQINRRINEINRLYHGHGMRRTVSTFSGSAQQQISQTVQSAGVTINRTFDVNTLVTKKCHIRWKPSSPCGLRPSPEQVRAWAVRAVHGFTLDLSTLWEITPWSWLADWFGDVGTFLKASRNIIPARVTGVHPMTHTKTRWNCPAASFSGGSMTPIQLIRETKLRSVSFVAPTAHLNFLSGNQMGILAALVAARSSRHAL